MCYHRIKKELIETFNLNSGIAFDKFINEGIYKLLGVNQIIPNIKGEVIEKTLKRTKSTPWIIYMSFFDLTNLELTRAEKRIIEWAKRLEKETPTNNTPEESKIIHELRNA